MTMIIKGNPVDLDGAGRVTLTAEHLRRSQRVVDIYAIGSTNTPLILDRRGRRGVSPPEQTVGRPLYILDPEFESEDELNLHSEFDPNIKEKLRTA
ncbi:hypothetical protein BDZ91DRAFT_717339 [Kalaharituber pfeilii]|nr:hypothetical protein BDZ91DRAFT_717339 [Kalaharituber pfeilii]